MKTRPSIVNPAIKIPIVNPQLELEEETCLVSILNYKGSTLSSYLPYFSNHSMLIVEWVVEEKSIDAKSVFQQSKSFIGRYEIAGLALPGEYERVIILNEGMPRPERIPQDAIVLHKEAYQVSAYWREEGEMVSKMHDLREKGRDGELILEPFKSSQHRAEPYVINREVNNQFVEKVISLYGCVPSDDKRRDSSLINKKMWITDIGCKEGKMEDKEFKDKAFHHYRSRSFFVEPKLAVNMVDSIKRDREICKQAAQGERDYLLYQLVGKNHSLSDPGAGDNCSGWCVDKLGVAGIHDLDDLTTKPKKLVNPSCAIL